jgi:hypothetical protein
MSCAMALGATRNGLVAWPRRSALRRGVRGLAPRATASGLSVVALGGSRPPNAVGRGVFPRLYNSEIQPKMS